MFMSDHVEAHAAHCRMANVVLIVVGGVVDRAS